MTDQSLLLFPQPTLVSRSNKAGGASSPRIPTHQRQVERLTPQFNQLLQTFNERRMELSHAALGVEPEQVLVIETIGSVENFFKAIKLIEGFEWLGECADDVAPDLDFYNEKSPEKLISGRLFMIMTNERSLKEMLKMWELWEKDKNGEAKFPHGLAKFRQVFDHLKIIRYWNVADRFDETGIKERWLEELEESPNEPKEYKIELWFRTSDEKRHESQQRTETLVTQLGGKILQSSIITNIAYHSILVELPANVIHEITSGKDVALIKSENIMFFRPTGQAVSILNDAEHNENIRAPRKGLLPVGDPVVAILDGVPFSNHELLVDRLIIDDPDDWSSSYTRQERRHGTSMASLVINGDLNDQNQPLKNPVYLRPVMKPDIQSRHFNSGAIERIPRDCLQTDLIYRSVRRIFEGDGREGAVAPSIKIICLAIMDSNRPYYREISPYARLLDWLAIKYNVLFLVSAGNYTQDIPISIKSRDIEGLSDTERKRLIIASLFNESRNRRLFSPAESINAITVGAAHFDNSEGAGATAADIFDPFCCLLPSPFSAFGYGHRRSIKPDVIFYGGRQLYGRSYSKDEIGIVKSGRAPGNRVACPTNEEGNLSSTIYSRGTSNATALLSNAGAQCYEALINILEQQISYMDYKDFVPVLLKAMLVHGSSWGEMASHIKEAIEMDDQHSSYVKDTLSKWLGYGLPDIQKVLHCTDQRVCLLGFGKLKDGDAHVFRFPLPPSLELQGGLRRVTVTLAWFSPISPVNQKYRSAKLWFEVENNISTNRVNVHWQSAQRGTVQHEIFEDEKAISYQGNNTLLIKVNCMQDAAPFDEAISYGLFVTLEVAEEINISIYNEVRNAITPRVKV